METVIEWDADYTDKILDTDESVLIDVYVMTNTITNKRYVGQAVTHRLNHGKYRPFGYLKRFKDHISEAVCNTKKKQCSFLNNSIRKHGTDAFTVELITRCGRDDGNRIEQYYIEQYDTLHPRGYNLTKGGNQRASTHEQRVKIMAAAQNAAYESKLSKFENVDIDIENLDQYLREYKSYGEVYYCVKIGSKRCIFVGKYQTTEELKQDAINFLKTVAYRSATSSNCGNLLRARSTTSF
jgi:hypothetical protein